MILNIGMKIGADREISLARLQATLFLFDKSSRIWLHQGPSEMTAVVQVHNEWPDTFVNDLAIALEQEAIAVYSTVRVAGKLVGPLAESWGDFNPQSFLLQDGRTLAKYIDDMVKS
jgi:hypothetical protein